MSSEEVVNFLTSKPLRIADIEKLAEMNLFGVIVGKAIYEGRVTLTDLMKWSAQ